MSLRGQAKLCTFLCSILSNQHAYLLVYSGQVLSVTIWKGDPIVDSCVDDGARKSSVTTSIRALLFLYIVDAYVTCSDVYSRVHLVVIFRYLNLKMKRTRIWLHVWYMAYRVNFSPFMPETFVNNDFVFWQVFRML